MESFRLIARLDVKGQNLIKGVHLEGLRKLGDPQAFARRYYKEGIDELIYMDIVASLYGRNNLIDVVRRTAEQVFIPITVGGGVRSVDDAKLLLRAGADKVAINTAAVSRPGLIAEMAEQFGSQAVVLSIEAKGNGKGTWEAFTDNGREGTGLDAVEWAGRAQRHGAGEILLTSVDREGTRTGLDIELLQAVSAVTRLPIIAAGGVGSVGHLVEGKLGGADAVAMADILHYRRASVEQLRAACLRSGLAVRKLEIQPDG
jgi:cyclase